MLWFVLIVDWSWNLEDTLIGMSVRVLPERFNCGRKTHSKCVACHPTDWHPGLNEKEKRRMQA